tara:strand:- start:330 stop:656 length:327 start_codon:yes stop_codon:yes gene_type:complete
MINKCPKCDEDKFTLNIVCESCFKDMTPHEVNQHRISSMKTSEDVVNHPSHYTQHPSGVECIQITEHMGFNLGNALKYIWRADLKNDAIEDMKKAVFYLNREIEKRTK